MAVQFQQGALFVTLALAVRVFLLYRMSTASC
jgi:hypothetical protein